MKVLNQIPAEVAGRIIAVLVENGAPVEFGQPAVQGRAGDSRKGGLSPSSAFPTNDPFRGTSPF